MSASWIDALVAYRRSRLPATTSLGLALFLGVAASVGGTPAGPRGLVWMCALAVTLVVQFRLGDDLADRAHDRRTHPERVLSRVRSLAPFRVALAATAGLNLLLLAVGSSDRSRPIAFLALSAALLAWYRWRPTDGPSLGGAHVTLLRYPVFVYLLSGASREVHAERLLLAMVAVYLSFGIYELLHDAPLRAAPGAAGVLTLELAALTALPNVGILALGASGNAPWLLAVVATVASGALTAGALRRLTWSFESGARAHAVFAVGLLVLLTFSPGGAP